MVAKRQIKIGDRVRIADNNAMAAWGLCGKEGTVTGRDPRGVRDDVVRVEIDNEPLSIPQANGVQIDHLEPIE